MEVKCVGRESGCSSFSIGGVYKVEKDGLGYYILCAVGDKLYFDLETGKCSWFNARLNSQYYTFEEVKEQPYATSPEVMAQVLRKMADNVEKGLRPKKGIQKQGEDYKWCEELSTTFLLATQGIYRVKPETITLKNRVEIPKPLDVSEICTQKYYYIPLWGYELHSRMTGYDVEKLGYKAYATKEQAIEASKALFGLEIKD